MGFLDVIGKIASPVSSVISGAFGIGSSILNNKAQKSANETNMRIAQMNNEWSEKMMEKQNQMNVAQWQRESKFAQQQAKDANAFTEYMQNKANEYNSAKNQASRLREAGLNPAIVMGGNNAGTAQGASGAQAATPSGNSVGLPSPSSATVQPLRYEGFANAINNSVQMLLAINRQNADIHNQNRSVDAEVALARAKIAELQEEKRSKEFHNNLNEITRDLQIQHMNEDYLSKVQERTNMEQQNKLVQQQVIAQELINQNLPEQLAMNIAVQASVRDLNRKNIDAVAEDIVRQSLENAKINYSSSQIERLKEATISALEASIGQGWLNAGVNAITSTLDAVSTFGGKKTSKSYHNHAHYTSIYNR